MATLKAAKTKKPPKVSIGEQTFDFQIRAYKLPEAEKQFLFAKELGRKFRGDFAWPKFKLIVEVQGGIWKIGGGGHSTPMGIENDIERHQHAALLGWTILPFTTDQVHSGFAVAWTMKVLAAKGWKPPK